MKGIWSQFNETLSRCRLASLLFAVALMTSAVAGVVTQGLNLGLDFTGGYITEFSTDRSVSQNQMEAMLTGYLPANAKISSAENGTYWTVRQADDESSVKGKAWLSDFALSSELTVTPQDAIYIGSQIGDELIEQGGLALLTATIAILIYLSLRFEWRLALGALIALCHDVFVVLGLFAWFGLSFDLTILASLLALIGYSLNDSIIVGDKIRELMKANSKPAIETIINAAIKSTFVRTLVTSGTTLATILAVWLFAGASLQGFSIALFSGIIVGTFSSIALSATIPQLLGLTSDYYEKQQQPVCDLP